ncbi:MAG: RagB/SusD family nutrient uptake outer membrane protein [Bacteroides sp.]|nr:RagB/SusD family nutrient uptake outer membrane protein [Ruminococcus flavefaciens]MCM1553990.1 RagB/SusD family nutrient uptake outer membrane protein [Bacteroides sp.]
MKKIKDIALLVAVVPAMLLSSCSKEYLDRMPTTALDTNMVLTTTDMIPSTVVGTMRMMYSSSFGGKYATVIGDIMTDMITSVRGSNGSFKDMEEWNINQSTSDVETLYGASFQIAAAAARTIEAAKKKLASDSASMTNTQKNNLKSAIAASLTIKAYAEYFVTQFFCVDVNVPKKEYAFDNNYNVPGNMPGTLVGIMLLPGKPLGLTDPANISSLKDTYKFLQDEIEEAIKYYDESGSKSFTLAGETRYYPTQCAAYMIQARIYLAQHEYEKADEAAANALANLPSGASGNLISNPEALLNAYGATLSSEDVWSLNYTNQDNLSANSLQNLFSSYGFNPSSYALSLFSKDDIRYVLHYDGSTHSLPGNMKSYCMKYPNENAVFNVPLLRVPEIYMVQAEARAALKDYPGAKEALLQVLGVRDTSIAGDLEKMEAKYKLGEEDIMQTILDENAREFLCEGHRWSDLRRNGARLTREGSSESKKFPTHFKNYPLSTFALPIPYGETSTEQWKKGLGDNGNDKSGNWQNNAWDEKQGDTYSPTVTLPIEGDDYTNADN